MTPARPIRIGRALLVATLVALGACTDDSEEGGLEDDVGAQLACEGVRENWAKVAADPLAYPGEAGEIVGAAESADDPGLREAAEAFDRNPSSATWDLFLTRCEELGLA